MEETLELKDKVLQSAVLQYQEKALKFTMDDVAKAAGISKKTIYTVFKDKEDLLCGIVDMTFDSVKAAENEISSRKNQSIVNQLRAILSVMPESYMDIDFSQLHELKGKYPAVYEHLQYRMENGWEKTLDLIEEGMKQGMVRKCNVVLFKSIYEATLESFFQKDLLDKTNLSYQEALNQVVDILIEGILVK